jgi:hypothetical protein
MLNGSFLQILKNMRIDMRRHLIIISAVLFFFVSLALALHHDDAPFQTVTCSICKVKNSSSAAPHKIKTGSTSVLTHLSSFISNTDLALSGRVPEVDIFHPSSHDFSAFSNKAPPVYL